MKFETGKTYQTRSICDSDMIIKIKVVSRTEKTIKAIVDNEEKTLRVKIWDGIESVMPWGKYSMAPCIKAA